MHQATRVANPACGQLNMETVFCFLSPFAPENLPPRDGFGGPSLPASTHLFSTLRLDRVLTHGLLLLRGLSAI